MRALLYFAALVPLVASAGSPTPETCPNADAPKAAVVGYLTAMREHRFEDAFAYVTANMTDGRSQADWSAMQKLYFERGKVDIYGIDTRPAKANADDRACEKAATVPNILRSRDKFNVLGVLEFESYLVLNSAQGWRVDSQEIFYEQSDIGVWFPDIELVEVAPPN